MLAVARRLLSIWRSRWYQARCSGSLWRCIWLYQSSLVVDHGPSRVNAVSQLLIGAVVDGTQIDGAMLSTGSHIVDVLCVYVITGSWDCFLVA